MSSKQQDKGKIIEETAYRDKSGLRSYVENHVVIIVITFSIVAFLAGWHALAEVQRRGNQELVTKGTYTPNSDLQNNILPRYVYRKQYDSLASENSDLKEAIQRLSERNNAELYKQISDLSTRRDTIRKSLDDIRARHSPMFYQPESSQPAPVSKEEQDAVDSIRELDQEISALLPKLK